VVLKEDSRSGDFEMALSRVVFSHLSNSSRTFLGMNHLAKILNPKFEYRNPKQIPNSKTFFSFKF